MRTSKVTTLVLMTLVWWALSPDTTMRSNLSAEATISQDKNDSIAINTIP